MLFGVGGNLDFLGDFVAEVVEIQNVGQAPRAVLGYFTLATSSIPRDRLPQKYVRGMPAYDLPLVLLARLAVDLRFAGKGLGHALISEPFRITLRVAAEVGCRALITDAYRDRIGWYAKYGFIPIEGGPETGPQKMFLDVRTIRAALAIEAAARNPSSS